jgi:UPF0716 family protein affecting phage T7 exclusion
VLWAQIGASPAYEIFIGTMELVCAVLLFIPGLTTLAAIVTLVTSLQIFLVNMTYDVPVKLFSFHLVLMALFLLAPDVRRLWRVIVMRRAVESAPKPPLYGIWEIERMTIDGVERAPLVTDYDRWRRLVIQTANGLAPQRMNDTFTRFGTRVDTTAKTIAILRGAGPQAQEIGRFAYQQPSEDRLVIDGQLNGTRMRMETRLFNREDFPLVKGDKFRLMQDVPFNR